MQVFAVFTLSLEITKRRKIVRGERILSLPPLHCQFFNAGCVFFCQYHNKGGYYIIFPSTHKILKHQNSSACAHTCVEFVGRMPPHQKLFNSHGKVESRHHHHHTQHQQQHENKIGRYNLSEGPLQIVRRPVPLSEISDSTIVNREKLTLRESFTIQWTNMPQIRLVRSQ